jgi:Fe2+ or Zn2+ uptake regulation protein
MIRIAGADGRLAHFAATHQVALGVLRVLEATSQGLRFQAIAARLATDGVSSDAQYIRNVLQKLRSIGIVRREKRGLYSRAAGYAVTVIGSPGTAGPLCWSPQQARRQAEARARGKIRIVGREGRAVQFTAAQHVALGVLRELKASNCGMKSTTIAARLAERQVDCDLQRVIDTLVRLRDAGLVHMNEQRRWVLDSDYVVTVIKPPSRVAPHWTQTELDWTQTDRELSHRLGLSRERIRQIRREQGIADPPFKHLQQPTIAFRLWLRQNRARAGALTAEQLATESGCKLHRETIARHMLAEGIAWVWRSQARPDYWLYCNWALPSWDLADIWGRSTRRFAIWRLRGHYRRPQWNRLTIHKKKGTPEYEEYCKALEAERRKAQAYRRALVQGPKAACRGGSGPEAEAPST